MSLNPSRCALRRIGAAASIEGLLMAVCTLAMISGGITYVVVDNSVLDPANCPGGVLVSASDYANFLAVSSAFGFDLEAFEMAVFGSLLMFGLGFGVGLIIQMIRRARTL
jgi:hypothetical protein